jgi:uncharacterized protein YjbJ (UPF0337 family)
MEHGRRRCPESWISERPIWEEGEHEKPWVPGDPFSGNLFFPAAAGKREHRRTIMKSSTKSQAKGKFHKVKGTIKEIAGKVSLNPDLEAEGKDEKRAGKVQAKIGEIEMVVGK